MTVSISKDLIQGLSFNELAKYLCKNPATISIEVSAQCFSDRYHAPQGLIYIHQESTVERAQIFQQPLQCAVFAGF